MKLCKCVKKHVNRGCGGNRCSFAESRNKLLLTYICQAPVPASFLSMGSFAGSRCACLPIQGVGHHSHDVEIGSGSKSFQGSERKQTMAGSDFEL